MVTSSTSEESACQQLSRPAIVFSSALTKLLDEDELRLPPTFVGVRRIRPSGRDVHRAFLDQNCGKIGNVRANSGNSAGGDNACNRANSSTGESVGNSADGDNAGNNAGDNAGGNVDRNGIENQRRVEYTIRNEDGTQRRMTKQEKKILKYQLKQKKHEIQKKQRQQLHEERIREAKAQKRIRRREKWLKRSGRGGGLRQNQQQENSQGSSHRSGREEQSNQHQQTSEANVVADPAPNTASETAPKSNANRDTHVEAHDNHQQPAHNTAKAKTQQSSTKLTKPSFNYYNPFQNGSAIKGENDCNNSLNNNTQTSNSLLEEELAALRGERTGIPPVMLVPSAAAILWEKGMFSSPLNSSAHTKTPPTSKHTVKPDVLPFKQWHTIMDHELTKEWAARLQRSMIPVEIARNKEKIRPMAYKLVPEVWSRLCPSSLWNVTDDESHATTTKATYGNDDDSNNDESTQPSSSPFQPPPSQSEATSDTFQSSISQPSRSPPPASLVPLRNPSPNYDSDAYLLLRHLHIHAPQLHIACGAVFGCDFLLYDGRRDERHSFAGVRLYGSSNSASVVTDVAASSAVDCSVASGGDVDTAKHVNNNRHDDVRFPIPTAYDMAGYVRAMNTARKIALVAMVVRAPIRDQSVNINTNNDANSIDNNNVARIAIVDLALEKILEAPTHVKKGSTVKRRSGEVTKSALSKIKQRRIQGHL